MMFLYEIAKTFDRNGIPYALVGGYAVALHGAVRGTVDVDMVIQLTKKDFINAEKALLSLGLEARLPVKADQIFDYREEYIRNRNLVAWSFYRPARPSDILDIIVTHDLRKMKTVTVTSSGHKLRVLSIPELIKMKKTSGRPQDLEDIRALEEILK